ncbi:unknown [Coprobacillus sp. CAG:605]|nr:unknown [Coprobacillus sp. CAG:605]
MDESVTVAEASKSFSSKVVIVNTATEEEPPIEILGKEITDTTQIATDDPDNNIRYIGKDPSNYVYFNCSDYSNQSDSSCEKWRIIGVFKNITKADGTKEDLVKIVRANSIGSFFFDYKKNGVGTSTNDDGSNDWTDSQLMMLLNPKDYLKSGYTIENNIVKDSNGQAIYQNMGSYYNGTSGCKPAAVASGADFTCTSIDFTSTGLKNDNTRNAIESVIWNLGSIEDYKTTVDNYYSAERSSVSYNNHATAWTGKIGLMYPSDYAYATAGSSSPNRDTCLKASLTEISQFGSYRLCLENNYFYIYSYWFLLSSAKDTYSEIYTESQGVYPQKSSGLFEAGYGTSPTLFLKSSVSISSGEGTSESPYQLSGIF